MKLEAVQDAGSGWHVSHSRLLSLSSRLPSGRRQDESQRLELVWLPITGMETAAESDSRKSH